MKKDEIFGVTIGLGLFFIYTAMYSEGHDFGIVLLASLFSLGYGIGKYFNRIDI